MFANVRWLKLVESSSTEEMNLPGKSLMFLHAAWETMLAIVTGCISILLPVGRSDRTLSTEGVTRAAEPVFPVLRRAPTMWPLAVLLSLFPLLVACGRFEVTDRNAIWGLAASTSSRIAVSIAAPQPRTDDTPQSVAATPAAGPNHLGSKTGIGKSTGVVSHHRPFCWAPPLTTLLLSIVNFMGGPAPDSELLLGSGAITAVLLLATYWFVSRVAGHRLALMSVGALVIQPQILQSATEPSPQSLAMAFGIWGCGEFVRHAVRSEERWSWGQIRCGVAIAGSALAGGWQCMVWIGLIVYFASQQRSLSAAANPLPPSARGRSPLRRAPWKEILLQASVPVGVAVTIVAGFIVCSQFFSDAPYTSADAWFALRGTAGSEVETPATAANGLTTGPRTFLTPQSLNRLVSRVLEMGCMLPFAVLGFMQLLRRGYSVEGEAGPTTAATSHRQVRPPFRDVYLPWLVAGIAGTAFGTIVGDDSSIESFTWWYGLSLIPITILAAVGWCACADRAVSIRVIGLTVVATGCLAILLRWLPIVPEPFLTSPFTTAGLGATLVILGLLLVSGAHTLPEPRLRELLTIGLTAALLLPIVQALPRMRPQPRSTDDFENLCQNLQSAGNAQLVSVFRAENMSPTTVMPVTLQYAMERTWPDAEFQYTGWSVGIPLRDAERRPAGNQAAATQPATLAVRPRPKHVAIVWSRGTRTQPPPSAYPLTRVGPVAYFETIECATWLVND